MPTHQLEKLNHIHLSMVELCLAGHSPEAIAHATSRTVTSVRMVIGSPLFQQELARRRGEQNKRSDQTIGVHRSEAKRILEESLVTAANRQIELLDSNDERVRQTAVSAIFDRTFGKQTEPAGQSGSVIRIEAGAMLNLQLALAEDSGLDDSLEAGDMVNGELVTAAGGQATSSDENHPVGESSERGLDSQPSRESQAA